MAGQQARALCGRRHAGFITTIKNENNAMATKKKIQLPEVNFSDYGDTRYLHLGTPWVQGSMNIDKPFDIDLESVSYTHLTLPTICSV